MPPALLTARVPAGVQKGLTVSRLHGRVGRHELGLLPALSPAADIRASLFGPPRGSSPFSMTRENDGSCLPGTTEVKPRGLQNALGSAHSRHCASARSDRHQASSARATGGTHARTALVGDSSRTETLQHKQCKYQSNSSSKENGTVSLFAGDLTTQVPPPHSSWDSQPSGSPHAQPRTLLWVALPPPAPAGSQPGRGPARCTGATG